MGLFNGYLKEGSGVEKDEREKKPFFRFFEQLFRYFWSFVFAGIVTNLICMPIITTGIGEVGMSRVSRTVYLNRPMFTMSDYFESIKKNWKQATAVCIIDGIILFLMYVSMYVAWFYRNVFFFALSAFIVMCIAALFFVMSTHYHYMLLMTCKLKLGQIYSNSFRLVGVGIKNSLIVTLVLAVFYGISYAVFVYGSITFKTIILFVFLLFYRPLRNYLISYNLFPVIRKNILEPYYKDHPDEDKELRHDLGMYEYPEE